MEKAPKLRVLIVDESPLTRFALGSITELHPLLTLCGEVNDAAAAREACVKEQPDLVVLDLAVSRGGGVGLLPELRKLAPAARMLVVSDQADEASVRRAFAAGARGYVTKRDEGTEVLAGLEKVLTGGLFTSKRVTDALLEGMCSRKAKARHAALETLSDREWEVFRHIGLGHGNTEVARACGVCVKTIETHRQRIKDKLGLVNAQELQCRAAQHAAEVRARGTNPLSISEVERAPAAWPSSLRRPPSGGKRRPVS